MKTMDTDKCTWGDANAASAVIAVVDAIATARAHGDLKENAEYHAAREQQSFNEGRINELEAKLSVAQIIDVTKMENDPSLIINPYI